MDVFDWSKALDGGSGRFDEGRACLSWLAWDLWMTRHDLPIFLLLKQTEPMSSFYSILGGKRGTDSPQIKSVACSVTRVAGSDGRGL